MKRWLPAAVQVAAAICAALVIHGLAWDVARMWEAPSPREPGDLPGRDRVDVALVRPHRPWQLPDCGPPDFTFPEPHELPGVPPPDPPNPAWRGDSLLGRRGPAGSTATPEDRARLAALQWLERHQHADGGWPEVPGDDDCARPVVAGSPSRIRETSLALLAFFADGSTHLSKWEEIDPVSSKVYSRGEVIKRGIKWLLCQEPKPPEDPGHLRAEELSLGTLALVEAYAMTESALFRDSAQKWLDQLLATHRGYANWATARDELRQDPPATTWALLAVGVARHTHLRVSSTALADAVEGLAGDGFSSTIARASCLTAGRLLSGDSRQTRGWFAEFRPLAAADQPASDLSCETLHWALLAAQQASPRDGATFRTWRRVVFASLLKEQCRGCDGCRSGSWNPPAGERLGRTALTALNALSLTVDRRYAADQDRADR